LVSKKGVEEADGGPVWVKRPMGQKPGGWFIWLTASQRALCGELNRECGRDLGRDPNLADERKGAFKAGAPTNLREY
jgi:hypothetical protein